ncbi:hypothetical protein BCR34DRAFT_560943 [Clohesyomyces aquaticus]|uniref:Uncharacterized protein n=1 Tax=Clohesyomyces aquaticus TaxID=1231657 RepID=A0A1Y1ZUS9_9PLEO|nr:hypothetical protein BCR34DRAFT_560943 [Clohesyomyces aquaticus]
MESIQKLFIDSAVSAMSQRADSPQEVISPSFALSRKSTQLKNSSTSMANISEIEFEVEDDINFETCRKLGCKCFRLFRPLDNPADLSPLSPSTDVPLLNPGNGIPAITLTAAPDSPATIDLLTFSNLGWPYHPDLVSQPPRPNKKLDKASINLEVYCPSPMLSSSPENIARMTSLDMNYPGLLHNPSLTLPTRCILHGYHDLGPCRYEIRIRELTTGIKNVHAALDRTLEKLHLKDVTIVQQMLESESSSGNDTNTDTSSRESSSSEETRGLWMIAKKGHFLKKIDESAAALRTPKTKDGDTKGAFARFKGRFSRNKPKEEDWNWNIES